MSVLERIDDDLKKALKARNELKATLLRGLKSDIKYRQIDKGAELSDDEIIEVLSSSAKKHRDSIEQFTAGKRQDLVDKESAELEIIREYLPQPLSEEKLRAMVAEAVEKSGAESPAQIGLVMKELMPQVKGKADGKVVKDLVVELLSNR